MIRNGSLTAHRTHLCLLHRDGSQHVRHICNLDKSLSRFQQCVKWGTRNNSIPDKCYGNTFTARVLPPLRISEHKAINLLPIYRSAFKSGKPEIKTLNVWSNDKVDELKGSFLCTDWSVFFQDTHVHEVAEIITDYISFWMHIIPWNTVKIYANNKPNNTKGVIECIRKKNRANRPGDNGLKLAQYEQYDCQHK